eukprot:TRINITY_DN90118_c0_g1_i1.p2 TRINITY_DN90118_c0_g1~~TRINITY_DN90118_c0_g1_i1.p2  ORF type:complete len:115 (-),score=6.61 TRINITY_DN90118_c0_g1_i1:10-354(-)
MPTEGAINAPNNFRTIKKATKGINHLAARNLRPAMTRKGRAIAMIITSKLEEKGTPSNRYFKGTGIASAKIKRPKLIITIKVLPFTNKHSRVALQGALFFPLSAWYGYLFGADV